MAWIEIGDKFAAYDAEPPFWNGMYRARTVVTKRYLDSLGPHRREFMKVVQDVTRSMCSREEVRKLGGE